MSSGTYRRNDYGLLVPASSGDGGPLVVQIARALREHDDALRLVPQSSPILGTYWAVYRYAGENNPAEKVCTWVDFATQEALPLSFGLVERVKQLDRGGRGADVYEADELEERRKARREKEQADAIDALVQDHHRPRGRRTILPRSPGLAAARRRLRRKRWNV